ncbi:hypothetical protein LXA43DRAFT_1093966 [Ganoderma leucocontextum]|nr:hypothetical protein LXA43DRAFT_1093966 [Ganoderma leucocontextum]
MPALLEVDTFTPDCPSYSHSTRMRPVKTPGASLFTDRPPWCGNDTYGVPGAGILSTFPTIFIVTTSGIAVY